MNAARAIATIALAVFYVLFAILMALGAYAANRGIVLRNEDRNVSGTPLVGSIAGTLAVLLAPIGTFRDRVVWAWVPLALEVALYGLLLALWSATGLRARAERQRGERRKGRDDGVAP